MHRLPHVTSTWPAAGEMATLVERALDRDQAAWRRLVDILKGVAWKVIYSFDLPEEDRKDVFASTFFRLHERLATIREPVKLPGWIATTARNEALTTCRARQRVVPMDDHDLPLGAIASDELDTAMLDDELSVAVRGAVRDLSPQHQALLRLLTTEPPLSYDEISATLGIPRGSIGPIRQRCLERLRNSPKLAAFRDGGNRATS